MKLRLLIPFILTAVLHAQQPPPPPPPDPGGGDKGIPGGNLDLSSIPVPEADKKTLPQLSEAEIKAKPVQISVVPIGWVSPPIIYIDKDGMPRERYRDPMEYPPVVYHIATEKGSIRLTGAHNQVAPPTAVPRRVEMTLSYEEPPNPTGDAVHDPKKGPSLKTIGNFPVPAGATHLVAVVWKDPDAKLWTNPQVKVIDVSPATVKGNEAVVINLSGRELAIHRGDVPYKIASGFMGKVALPVNAKGQVPMVVAAASGVGWQQLSRTVLGPRKDDRIFVLAWQAPETPAQPAGVALQAIAKRLPEAKAFEPSK
ncbi:hypothetical protein OKA04_22855 [Luteolibacter flavescens]|uniref:Uncharacterized protein n=1 Tax=Luteolibacter flavescens TaxID=1859460 RepID=A0ABT3FVK4_9BACT|nr:hypothetical protein [Luteolibacter flavescens]MCW1887595.1 hypothetical protein [Luteolibacter flavescens]